MNIHNIQYLNNKKFPKYLFSWAIRKKFIGTEKRVWMNHGKLAIGVRAIEVRLYVLFSIILHMNFFITRFIITRFIIVRLIIAWFIIVRFFIVQFIIAWFRKLRDLKGNTRYVKNVTEVKDLDKSLHFFFFFFLSKSDKSKEGKAI